MEQLTEHLNITWEKEDYIKLCDDSSALIIGCRVKFTKSEYAILNFVFNSTEPVTMEDIINNCLKHKDVTRGNAAVHIFNLNKKVSAVTGRRLIVDDHYKGYVIASDI